MGGDRLARALLWTVLLAGPAFAGCIGDSGDDIGAASTDGEPADATDPIDLPAEIASLDHQGNADLLDVAKTLWIDEERDLAYVTQNSAGFTILDLSTHGEPEILGREPDATGRDVALIEHDDG